MMKRWLVLICLFVMAVSVLPMHVRAESPFFTDDITLTPDPLEGVSEYIFLYTGENKGLFDSNKVEIDIERGYMHVLTKDNNLSWTDHSAYPPMEVRVWRWDMNMQQWLMEQHFDIYSSSGETVKFKEDQGVYCLQLYFWRPLTVAKSYHENREFYMYTGFHKTSLGVVDDILDAQWSQQYPPSVTVSAGDTVIFHHGNPTPVLPHE